ncbi:hypothetical protein D3C71_1587220 [compost metagenome]
MQPEEEETNAAVNEYSTHCFEPPDTQDEIDLSKEHLLLEFGYIGTLPILDVDRHVSFIGYPDHQAVTYEPSQE